MMEKYITGVIIIIAFIVFVMIARVCLYYADEVESIWLEALLQAVSFLFIALSFGTVLLLVAYVVWAAQGFPTE